MQRYEVLVLTVPEITNDELKQMESQLDRLVTDSEGGTLSFERWGKFRLTYPVRGNEYGVYCLMRFEAPSSLINDMRDFFAVKLHNIAMRHLISRVDSDSLVYQRPKSLEEATTSRDVDTFLKENQMGGLLSSMGEKKTPAKEVAAEPALRQASDFAEATTDTQDDPSTSSGRTGEREQASEVVEEQTDAGEVEDTDASTTEEE